jgi:hypothetical protein
MKWSLTEDALQNIFSCRMEETDTVMTVTEALFRKGLEE